MNEWVLVRLLNIMHIFLSDYSFEEKPKETNIVLEL